MRYLSGPRRADNLPWLVSAIIILSSCTSNPTPTTDQPETSVPPEPRPVVSFACAPDQTPFLGVASRRADRSQELEIALRHAAEQIARTRSLEARVSSVTQRRGASVGYATSVDVVWDRSAVDEIASSLEPAYQRQAASETYVGVCTALAVRTATSPPGRPMLGGGDEPDWIARIPTVASGLVGVGVAERRRTARDSIDAADEQALVNLAGQANTSVRMIRDSGTLGPGATETAAQEASATIEGFYVAERYVTSDGRYYYSLAVGTTAQ